VPLGVPSLIGALMLIGGLVSSTLRTLVVLPSLYYLLEGAKERREEKRTAVVMEMPELPPAGGA